MYFIFAESKSSMNSFIELKKLKDLESEIRSMIFLYIKSNLVEVDSSQRLTFDTDINLY